MPWKLLFLLLTFLCAFSCSSQKPSDIPDVDFDVSLGASRIGKRFFCKKELDRISYETYHSLWNSNRPKKASRKESSQQPIPKTIHQLWLSSDPLPEEYKKCQATWIKHHPKWEYHLWTQRDVEKLPERIQAYLKTSKDIEEKEALLKATILFELGGVVVDIAFECFKPLDAFHERYDFYASLEPPLTKSHLGSTLHISPLIIGAISRHPITYYWQQQMLQQYSSHNEELSPRERALICACMPLDEAVRVLGVDSEYVNIILPPTYFFPLNSRALKHWSKNQMKPKKRKDHFFSFLFEPKKPLFSVIVPESYAVHHRGGLWGKELIKPKKIVKKVKKHALQSLIPH